MTDAVRPVFDAHVDSLQLALDLGRDLGEVGAGHLDLERGRAGGLGAVVFVSWCDPAYLERGPGAARARTEALLREFHSLVARHGPKVRFAGNGSELAEANRLGAIAGIPGIEGGHSLEGELDALERFFEAGVRVLTLCWNNHLPWIRSCQDGAGPYVPTGLNAFGREVVRRLNELGVVCDLSHAGERSFYDALEASSKPVIASHSACKALHDHPRNLTDEQLRALAENGGVVGIVFCPGFLDAAALAEERRLREADGYRSIDAANDTELMWKQGEWLQEHAAPLPATRVVDHIVHAVEVAGIDHVGVGTDYDGIQRRPTGLEDATCYGLVAHLLAQRGFSDDDVAKVLGGNLRRVYAEVTGPRTAAATASLRPAALAADQLPST